MLLHSGEKLGADQKSGLKPQTLSSQKEQNSSFLKDCQIREASKAILRSF